MNPGKRNRKRIQHYLEYQGLRILLALLEPLSFRTLGRVGSVLGSVVFCVFRVRRKVTIDNLEHAFPEKTSKEIRYIAHRTYQNFGRTFLILFVPFGFSATLER